MRNKFNNLFSIQYFTSRKTTGTTEIYLTYTHEKQTNKKQPTKQTKPISIWKVFGLKSSARAKKKFISNRDIVYP